MRPRGAKIWCVVAALAVSAVFYGHYYTSLVADGSTPRTAAGGGSLPATDGAGKPSVSMLFSCRIREVKPQVLTKVRSLPSCPLSLRLRVNGSLYKKRFNFQVPVLMWDSHMNPEAWDTLSQRPVPYGWQGLPQEAVSSTLKLLNESANRVLFDWAPPRGCVRCAVVGNGGILNGSRKGREIDGHDYVFRMNGAVTEGFEADVGTKTSFYGFTVNTVKNSLIAYEEFGFTQTPQGEGLRYIFIPSDLRDYIMLRSAVRGVPVPDGVDIGDKPSNYFGPGASPKKFKLLHPEFLRYIKDSFLKSNMLDREYADLYMPSTGALMLLTALHSCDKVSAYGFITPDYKLYSDHYYEREKKPLIFYANHDMLLEMELWSGLHKGGILQLYQR